MKTKNLNLRVTDGEAQRIQALADFFCAGDKSNLQRQLFKAAETAMLKHGSKTKWPPVLNYYPENTKTRQDIDSALHLEDDPKQPPRE